MEQNKQKIYFADLGNSRAKFLTPDGSFIAINNSDLISDLNSIAFLEDSICVYASVNPDIEELISKKINAKSVVKAIEHIKNFKKINISHVEGMGEDRIFGLLGGLSISTPPIITIDCGTAVTINVLDKSGIIKGGVIMPGINLQALSLRNHTKGLHDFSMNLNPQQIIGTNTSEAISSGIIYGISGAIESIIQKIIKDYFQYEKVNVFLLGGNSHYLKKHVETMVFEYDENLVLKGLKHLFNNISS